MNSHNNALSLHPLQTKLALLQTENAKLSRENKNLVERCTHYQEQYATVSAQLQQLIRKVFGSQSERFVEAQSNQLSLFDNDSSITEHIDDTLCKDDGNTITIETHQRKRKNRHDNWSQLPVRVVEIRVDNADRVCACGCQKVSMGYDASSRLHYIPAVLERLEERREKLVCPKGCEKSIAVAPLALRALPKVSASEELLAHIITSKVEDRQPLYHLEHKNQGVQESALISRQSMADWFIATANICQPIINLLADEAIDSDIVGLDATSLQVLREDNRNAQTKSLVFCLRGTQPNKEVTLYHYNAIAHKPFLSSWLSGFNGTLQVDADKLFDDLEAIDHMKRSFCHAHARRKFEPIVKLSKKPGQAKKAMQYFKALYRVEREAKDRNLPPDKRYLLRQEKSKPIMDEFEQWLRETQPHILPKSNLGTAVNYCLKHWHGLSRFLDDGRLEIDNNLTEQAIKPFVMARKNFLFACTPKGAQALCIHFSIVRTAKQHGMNPYDYYVTLLKKIPFCKTIEDYEQLLPWNIKQQQEHECDDNNKK